MPDEWKSNILFYICAEAYQMEKVSLSRAVRDLVCDRSTAIKYVDLSGCRWFTECLASELVLNIDSRLEGINLLK